LEHSIVNSYFQYQSSTQVLIRTPAVDNNLQATFENLFISASFLLWRHRFDHRYV